MNVITRQLQRVISPASWDSNRAGEIITAAMDGNGALIEELAGAGARLDALTSREAAYFLILFANRRQLTDNDSNGDPTPHWHLKGSALAKARLAHNLELGAAKDNLWKRMIELGLPLANTSLLAPADELAEIRYLSDRSVPSAAWAYAAEAARGGFLAQDCFLHWARLQFAFDSEPLSAAACKAPLSNMEPLEFAANSGMPMGQLPKSELAELIALQGDGCPIDELLAFLSNAGCKLAGSEPIVDGYNGLSESLIGRLLHIGASPSGIACAARLGIDLCALDNEGRNALETLYGLDRAGRYAERAAALLDAAENIKPGSRRRLLDGRSAKDQSGPMHWAARALCPQSLGLFADLGLDPNAQDKSGKTAGHWAAKKYGAKRADKVGPTLAALSEAGQKWDALDNKGTSALAELAKKAPLDPVASLLDTQTTALHAKGSRAASAIDTLRARESRHAKALAEKADLRCALPAEGQRAAPQAPKSKPHGL